MATQGLTRSQFLDLIVTVNDNFPPDKSFEYLFDSSVHSFELVNRLFADKKVELGGGTQISRFINWREDGSAQFVLPTQTYQPGIVATMKELTIPWRFAHGEWSIVRFEAESSVNPEELVDLVKTRRQPAQMDLALLIEKALWDTYDSDSDTAPLGLTYYIGPYVTGQTQGGAFQSTGGYDNGTAAILTSIAGISSSAQTRWKNWSFDWPNPTGEWSDEALKYLGRMHRNLRFETPMLVTDLAKPRYDATRLYTNEVMIENAETRARQQNDQVGADLGRYQGVTLYRGLPLIWQSQLDTADTNARATNPIYMVNYNYIYPVVRRGNFFRTDTFPGDKYQPDVVTNHIDISYNVLCTNRQLVGGMGGYVGS